VFAQREVITADLNLDRVAQRRKANQLDGCPDQKAHFQNAAAVFGRNLDLANGASPARLQRSQRLSFKGHRLPGACPGSNRLNEDVFGQLRADAKACITNLANDVGLAAHQPNLLLFAKAQFAEAVADFWRSGKLLDTNGRAGDNTTQRAKERLSAASALATGYEPIHYGPYVMFIETELQEAIFIAGTPSC